MVVTPRPALLERAEHHPALPALVDRTHPISWSEVAERSVRMANALLEFGFPMGSRLGVLGDNRVDTVLVYAAAGLAGVGAILLNHHQTAEEIEYVLGDGGAQAIWATPEFLPVAALAARGLGIPVLCDSAGSGPWTTLVDGASGGCPPVDLPATSDLVYTSGTTGRPKGVEFPGEPAPTIADRLEQMGRHHMAGLGPHLVVGPLYHAGPHGAVGLLLNGSTVVVGGRFDAAYVLDAIERFGIATAVTVPTHLVRLLGLPDERRRSADVSSLRMISVTGSTCPIPLMRAMIEWFGPVFLEAYGASESGIISRIWSEEWLQHQGSVGRLNPPFHALVIDEDGAPSAPGADGVLYFVDDTGRGIRYHNDPEMTAAAHRSPGTFTLGDIGHVDRNGYLYITGRVTDMVISGGVNIYPAECERVLSDHPSVRDVALFGVPDEEMGEQLVGVVSLHDHATSTGELIDFCRQAIAAYKVPRRLAVVDEVPRSPMGKVDKTASRHVYLDADSEGSD